ncbi:hypothetical protein MPSEU_000666100 [Mayamaea pseudoterrestris]|nr:hypothetical protein MPSEU_000666100 [Mayamaea pseudoterrestris]
MRVLASLMKINVSEPTFEILHLLSTLSSSSIEMTQSRELLPTLAKRMTESNMTEQALLDGLGCLKNVSCYAEERRSQLLCTPGFKDCICILAKRLEMEKTLERLSATFRNLSISPECRSIMTGDALVLDALLFMSSNHMNMISLQRNLLNTFVSLSMEHDACVVLLFHGDGVLLECLQAWLQYDADSVLRKRASRLVRSLANDLSGPMLVQNTKLMDLISRAALQDEDRAVRIEATEAFARCASQTHTGQPNYTAVLDALVQLARRPNACTEAIASALREQASRLDHRVHIAKCPELLAAAAMIAMARNSSIRSKENICIALLDLTYEESNLHFSHNLVYWTHSFTMQTNLVHFSLPQKRNGGHL